MTTPTDSNDRDDSPPSFSPINPIELVSTTDSKILGVSVYSGRAEVTRLFTFDVKTGQNRIVVRGLPNVLDHNSLRVEGRGKAMIHDVTISSIPHVPTPTTSPALEALYTKLDETQLSLVRCQKSLQSLGNYLGSLHSQHTDVKNLAEILETCEKTGESLDREKLRMERELKKIREEIGEERKRLSGGDSLKVNKQLKLMVSIGVFAESEGEVEIVLIYGVSGATWDAGYDVRVDTQTKEYPVSLLYKAGITQTTGEDWEDAPLSLETAAPTFGLQAPTLDPWRLYVPVRSIPIVPQQLAPQAMIIHGASPVNSRPHSRSRSRSPRRLSRRYRSPSYSRSRSRSRTPPPVTFVQEPIIIPSLQHRVLAVTSKGDVTATFTIPGLTTVPSDGKAHNVTIAKLALDAEMTWICVPKKDLKTHLNARIKNDSQYSLVPGSASVYVDGSFISRSNIPSVSPEETFDCPLGLDSSIRITYHPRVKKVTRSGFYNKSAKHVVSQHITVFNSKPTPLNNVKIIDHIPISEDSNIHVNLVTPPLVVPSPGTTSSSTNALNKVTSQVKIENGVVAQWDGGDVPGNDLKALGKDGKLNWVCSVPAQGKVNLLLQFEVSVPAATNFHGL